MPDAIFSHPRLARIHNAFGGDRDDLTAYLRIADELGADRVLGVGCGTGSPAAHGYRVLDVRQAPDRPGREFVFVAERTT
ncbi:hypothetical protein [Planomonospora venezuelensis]|uniref:Uncharacterized protein n=1 Tax=Planomonospora venezuelensis TaxID=1999 RepID=A0A841DCT8_PLAVE|nr:hypothetical protein [Planomonospora venezuelensis]MBB5966597.1 hypothetical protein [Planomonospora venezuelensis]GIN02225.1 hypothetical protein Pve01_38830 [Planomonospora venezuelensis]